jgi:dihydroorotate dehydrogenase electron transfer subunit
MQTVARLVHREELPGGRLWLSLAAPTVAARAQPGQLVALRTGLSNLDPLLRTPLTIAGADPAAGIISLLIADAAAAPQQRPGDDIDLLAPIGRGWRLHDQTRNIILLGDEQHLGALLFMAQLGSRRSVNMSLLVGAAEGRPPLPGAMVPAAVEYQYGRGVDPALAALDLLDSSLLGWADALYTTLPQHVYPELAERVRAGRIQWPPGFAHGLLVPLMACFCGICDTCLVPEARRPWRACVDGPQCDVRDFVRR